MSYLLDEQMFFFFCVCVYQCMGTFAWVNSKSQIGYTKALHFLFSSVLPDMNNLLYSYVNSENSLVRKILPQYN